MARFPAILLVLFVAGSAAAGPLRSDTNCETVLKAVSRCAEDQGFLNAVYGSLPPKERRSKLETLASVAEWGKDPEQVHDRCRAWVMPHDAIEFDDDLEAIASVATSGCARFGHRFHERNGLSLLDL